MFDGGVGSESRGGGDGGGGSVGGDGCTVAAAAAHHFPTPAPVVGRGSLPGSIITADSAPPALDRNTTTRPSPWNISRSDIASSGIHLDITPGTSTVADAVVDNTSGNSDVTSASTTTTPATTAECCSNIDNVSDVVPNATTPATTATSSTATVVGGNVTCNGRSAVVAALPSSIVTATGAAADPVLPALVAVGVSSSPTSATAKIADASISKASAVPSHSRVVPLSPTDSVDSLSASAKTKAADRSDFKAFGISTLPSATVFSTTGISSATAAVASFNSFPVSAALTETTDKSGCGVSGIPTTAAEAFGLAAVTVNCTSTLTSGETKTADTSVCRVSGIPIATAVAFSSDAFASGTSTLTSSEKKRSSKSSHDGCGDFTHRKTDAVVSSSLPIATAAAANTSSIASSNSFPASGKAKTTDSSTNKAAGISASHHLSTTTGVTAFTTAPVPATASFNPTPTSTSTKTTERISSHASENPSSAVFSTFATAGCTATSVTKTTAAAVASVGGFCGSSPVASKTKISDRNFVSNAARAPDHPVTPKSITVTPITTVPTASSARVTSSATSTKTKISDRGTIHAAENPGLSLAPTTARTSNPLTTPAAAVPASKFNSIPASAEAKTVATTSTSKACGRSTPLLSATATPVVAGTARINSKPTSSSAKTAGTGGSDSASAGGSTPFRTSETSVASAVRRDLSSGCPVSTATTTTITNATSVNTGTNASVSSTALPTVRPLITITAAHTPVITTSSSRNPASNASATTITTASHSRAATLVTSDATTITTTFHNNSNVNEAITIANTTTASSTSPGNPITTTASSTTSATTSTTTMSENNNTVISFVAQMLSLGALLMAAIGSALISLAVCLHEALARRLRNKRQTSSQASSAASTAAGAGGGLLPSLHYRESSLNARLLARCGLRKRVFSPPFWLRSGHVQTLVAAILPRGDGSQEVTFQREYLQMRDKGVVALDWVISVQPRVKRKSTVLLVLPPVTGDAFTVASLCCLASKRGFRTLVFNRRGHGGSVLTTPKLQSSADPSDLRQVIKYLRLRFPKSRLAAVAYGTGCGLLISYLGEFGSSALLSAGACVSPCYDTAERFFGSLRSVYDLLYLLKLKSVLLSHAKALASVVDVRHALNAWSFRAYEERVYCKMYNYITTSAASGATVGNSNPSTPAGGPGTVASGGGGGGGGCCPGGGGRGGSGSRGSSFSSSAPVAVGGGGSSSPASSSAVSSCSSPSGSTSTVAAASAASSSAANGQLSRGSFSGASDGSGTNFQLQSQPHSSSSLAPPLPPQQQQQQPSLSSSLSPNPTAVSPSAASGSVEEYWERNNPIRDVDDIAVPVLCINSLDDPIHGSSAIPYDLFRCYPNFLLVATEKGGHCGFLESYFPFRSWADLLCLDYLEAVFEFTTKGYAASASSSTAAATLSSSRTTAVSSRTSSSSSGSRKNVRSTI